MLVISFAICQGLVAIFIDNTYYKEVQSKCGKFKGPLHNSSNVIQY